MTTASTTSTRHGRTQAEIERAIACVAEIDLRWARKKLTDPDGSYRWSQPMAEQVEAAYRRFLALNRLYPEKRLVPTVDVDELWHLHILNTRAYQADCARSLGFFLHHVPTIENEDVSSHFAATQELARESFGSSWGATEVASCSRCGGCNSSGCSSRCAS